jgi:hypothetical protein
VRFADVAVIGTLQAEAITGFAPHGPQLQMTHEVRTCAPLLAGERHRTQPLAAPSPSRDPETMTSLIQQRLAVERFRVRGLVMVTIGALGAVRGFALLTAHTIDD